MASNKLTDIMSIGTLTALKTLDLSSNSISALPSAILNNLCFGLYSISLSKDISLLRHVQELTLSKNDIKNLPESLSGMCMLKNLTLSQNKVKNPAFILMY